MTCGRIPEKGTIEKTLLFNKLIPHYDFQMNKNRLCSKTCGVDEKQNLVEGWG